MELEHSIESLVSYIKINSQQFEDINIKYDTTKLLEGNISKTFSDINCTNIFDHSSKTKEIKAKIHKWSQ